MALYTGEWLPKELQHFKERDLRWLWHYQARQGYPFPPEPSVMRSERDRRLAAFIDESPEERVSYIKAAHRDFLVGESHLNWLDKGDDRLLIWMLIELESIADSDGRYSWSLPDISTPEARRNEIILALDLWNVPVAAKKQFLEEKKRQWAWCKTPDRDTGWINPKDRDQLHWAWNYCRYNRVRFKLSPVTDREYYIYTLAALDNMQFGHPAAKELFIQKMKKTWSQKSYRESGKAKKQYYMPLTEDAKSKLERLAEQKKVKRHEFIEGLIQKEFEQTFRGG